MKQNTAYVQPFTPRGDDRKTLGIVFLTVFLDLVGFGIIIPIQPFYAETLGASPAVVTLLGGSFSLMQFLFAPFWGRLSDRIGRRPVMLMSILASAVGYTLFGMSKTLGMLFAARMLAGFGSANIGTAQAIIADSTDEERRAKGMGLVGAAFGLGFIFGPALGGMFGQFGLSAPAYLAAALCAGNWVFAFLKLPETNPVKLHPKPTAPSTVQLTPGFSWTALKHAARHQNVPQIFCLYLLFTTAFSSMEQVLGLFIEKTWLSDGLTALRSPTHAKQAAALTAYVLIVVGVTATIVQGGLIGKLAKKFGERQLLMTGTALVAVSLFLVPIIGMVGVFAFLMVLAGVMAIGTGMTNPSLSSLLSKSVNKDEQGGALGMGQSLAALGRVLGPSMAGALFELYGGLPFWVGAVLMVLCTSIALSIHPENAKAPSDAVAPIRSQHTGPSS